MKALKLLFKIIDLFIPKKLVRERSKLNDSRFLVSLLFGLILFWLPAELIVGYVHLKILLIPVAFLALFLTLFRLFGSFTFTGNAIAVVLTGFSYYRISISQGAIFSDFWWLSLVPVIAVLTVGRLSALFWLVINISGLVCYFFMLRTGAFDVLMPGWNIYRFENGNTAANFVGLSVVIFIIIAFMEKSKNNVLDKSNSKIAESMRMMNNAHDIREDINRITVELKRPSENLSKASNNMKLSSNDISSMLTEASVAVSQGSDTIQILAQTLNDSADQIGRLKELTDSAGEKGKVGEQLTIKSFDAVHKIEKATDEILSIVAVMTEIADSSHLVSLNASIEGVKAIDHGYDFSVVVEEIKKLATRSNDALVEIRKLIRQTAITSRSGRYIVIDTLEMFERINGIVRQIAVKVQGISRAIIEQDAGIQEIARGFEETAAVSKDNATIVRELNQSIDDIYSATKGLNRVLGQLIEQASVEETPVPV